MMAKEQNIPELIIGVFDNGSDDLLRLDLSWLNLKIFRLEDPCFRELIVSKSYKNQQYDWAESNMREFGEMMNNNSGYHPYLYAFVPINFAKPVKESTFYLIEQILLVMFPSDFQLRNLISFNEEDTDKFTIAHWSNHDPYSQWWIKGNEAGLEDFLLKFPEVETKNVNDFFKIAWKNLRKLGYLQLAVRTYINSFKVTFLDMKVVSLCITLESLTNARAEITFQLARACAVINSESADEGKTIFHNAKQFYSLRSAIVHGDKYHYIGQYFFNLQALVSRTLVELINLNIPDRDKLISLINQSGYGDRSKWITNYVKVFSNNQVVKLSLEKVDHYNRQE